MASTLKLLATIGVFCVTIFALLFAFGIVTKETLSSNSLEILAAIAILVVAVVSLKAIAGRGPGGRIDPPPTL